MLVQENIGNDLVKTYSDQGMMIQGGFPEGLYAEAIDPISAGRTYIETDIPIPEEEQEEVEEFDLVGCSTSSFDSSSSIVEASVVTM